MPRELPKGVRDPEKVPGDVANWWGWLGRAWAWRSRLRGPYVSEGDVYGLPAAWRCLNWIGNAVASCAPVQVVTRDTDNAVVRLDPVPAVAANPWPMLTPHDYWKQVTSSLLLYGNFVGVLADWDPNTGWPRQVVPLPTSEVTMTIEAGEPVYSLYGGQYRYSMYDVIHLRGYTPPGSLWGIGVIEAFRSTIGEGMDHQTFGGNVYGGSGVPPLVIGVDRPDLTETQAEAIAARFHQRHIDGNREPAVIPSSMSLQTLAFTPADAQFLEARRWNATEIAWMFGMDPADLGVSMPGASLTYGNLDQRNVERLTHVLGPWLRPIEQGWSLLLPGGQRVRFNVENLLRTETSARLEASKVGLDMGLFTLNDVRMMEQLPLYDDWADEPFAGVRIQAALNRGAPTDVGDENDNGTPEGDQALGTTEASAEVK